MFRREPATSRCSDLAPAPAPQAPPSAAIPRPRPPYGQLLGSMAIWRDETCGGTGAHPPVACHSRAYLFRRRGSASAHTAPGSPPRHRRSLACCFSCTQKNRENRHVSHRCSPCEHVPPVAPLDACASARVSHRCSHRARAARRFDACASARVSHRCSHRARAARRFDACASARVSHRCSSRARAARSALPRARASYLKPPPLVRARRAGVTV